MLGASKLSWCLYGLLLALLAGALLAVAVERRKTNSARLTTPLHDWDIPRLANYLNTRGLALRLVSTRKDGAIGQMAFLTTTNRGWDELNGLAKSADWIDRWRGTLFCEWNMSGEDLLRQLGDHGMMVGPFLFFGDPELLERVRAALDQHQGAGQFVGLYQDLTGLGAL